MFPLTIIPEWMAEADCATVDPELWYPEKGVNPNTARNICTRCPVQTECLEYALTNGERYGMWGGTTEAQRAVILRDRRKDIA